jgi:hypothetical protein
MGLDKDDEIIRRRLAQKFDFMQTDLTEIPTPSEEDLEQFYKNNPALFRSEATVSFSHIYFSTDNSNDSIAKQRAAYVFTTVKKATCNVLLKKETAFLYNMIILEQALVDIQQNFGEKPILMNCLKGR